METPDQHAKECGAHMPALAVRTALALIGFSAVIGQIVLMRELIVVFNGNEMSLGILLATWLFWTAGGSFVASVLKLGGDNARRAVAVLECLLAVCLPPTIWALRASRSLFQSVPGELVGPVPTILASLACLSLFCIVSGALFVAATRMVQQECGVSASRASSLAYLLDAAGSGFGGLLASVLLLRLLGPFQTAAGVSLLNVCMATALLCRMSRKRLAALSMAALLVAVPLFAVVAQWLNSSAEAVLWRGFRVIASRDSIYGNLTITETSEIRSVYDNGILLANAPDESAAEEAVHYALLEHPAPRRVLLIGGGVNGSIAQVLMHPTVERVDYVELDPTLIAMARQFIPAQSAALDRDARVHVHYADGRYYLRSTSDSFDVIIVNLPDPQTAQLNRFYTAEFFRSARDHLAPGGLLALELRSSEETISPGLAEFLRCIHRTLKEVFPYVAIVPGETIHFFAASQPGVVSEDPKILISRLRERKLNTQYVREYFIPFRMTPDRMEEITEQLRPLPSTPINRDFHPIAYSFDVVLWSAQFRTGYSSWFRAAAHTRFSRVIGTVLIVSSILAGVLSFARTQRMRARGAAAYCVAAAGFTLMTLQILLLLAFQSIFGYLYHQLAILIAMSMAGIALGSWLGIRRVSASGYLLGRTMALTQFLLALASPALMLALSLMAQARGWTATWLVAWCVFPAAAALCGMLGGLQFPIATAVYLQGDVERRGIGTLYAVDLLGGCVGALLLSTWLIPVFGFWTTAWLCTVLNLAPALLATRIGQETSAVPA